MHRLSQFVLGAAAALAAAGAAACPLTDAVATRYGITFAGFDKPAPASAEPPAVRGAAYLRFVIPDNVAVADGFHHAVLVDVARQRAWIHRTGGFAPTDAWFGPVDVAGLSTAGCRDEYHARAAGKILTKNND